MKKNLKGFTLVELIGVIVIISILLLIAVPEIADYIKDSKRQGYAQTASAYIRGVKASVASLKYRFTSSDSVYYVPISCIPVEKGGRSPYGDLVEAYVVVFNDDGTYKYYWTSYDEKGYGVILTAEKDIRNLTITKKMSSINKNLAVDGITSHIDINSSTCLIEP